MGSLLVNCSDVLHTATPHKTLLLLRSGPGLGSYFGRRTEEVQSTEVADWRSVLILGFGVKEVGRSHGGSQGEQKVEEWGHMCEQDRRHTADDI